VQRLAREIRGAKATCQTLGQALVISCDCLSQRFTIRIRHLPAPQRHALRFADRGQSHYFPYPPRMTLA
jgi:hypothetical protein